jgi:hypothetical protein
MALRENDLINLVDHIFGIDCYKSKLGNDRDTCVLSFTVEFDEPAKDLENFLEMGYNYILDADVSPGEMEDDRYRVYVEIERSRHLPEQILEILDGLEKLTSIEKFKFRYYKSFRSHEATEENIRKFVPIDGSSYDRAVDEYSLNNFSNFFSNSYVSETSVLDETITFKNAWGSPVKFNIVASGPKTDVYDSVKGPIMLESKDIAETMFFTKYIGNYNITKVGNTFIFENKGWAVALEKL